MRISPPPGITIFFSFLILTLFSQPGMAVDPHDAVIQADGRVLHHAVFANPSGPEERDAVKSLIADWTGLPHGGVSENWNRPSFRKKVRFTSVAVDLNRDGQKEVLVRLVLHEKDTYLCLRQSCLSFLMERTDGVWKRGNQASSLNMMLGETIDVLDQYNQGYASFQTPAFIAGKGYLYRYQDSVYFPEIVELQTKSPKISLETGGATGTGETLCQLTLQETPTAETREAVEVFLGNLALLAGDSLADVTDWNDPDFRKKLIVASAAIDLNRDSVKEVLIRLDTRDREHHFCISNNQVTTCETFIMQFQNGNWRQILQIPLATLKKITVINRYHHGFADLAMAGTTFSYNGYFYEPDATGPSPGNVENDEEAVQQVRDLLDRNEDLQQKGIHFRVIGVIGGIVFLDLYRGNQGIRKKVHREKNYNIMEDNDPSLSRRERRDLEVMRKALASVMEMPGIQLVQLRPGIPDGKMALSRDRPVHRVSLASGEYLEDMGFLISADSFYLDDSGLLHATLTLTRNGSIVARAETDPFKPLVYDGIVFYPAGLKPEETIDIQVNNTRTGKTFRCTLGIRTMKKWVKDGAKVGFLESEKEGRIIKRAKLWFKMNSGKSETLWLDMGHETTFDESPYTLFVRQTYNPILDIYFEKEHRN